MDTAQKIKDALAQVLAHMDIETSDVSLERPADLQNGDYSSNIALQFSKQLGKNPRELAEAIVSELGEIDGVGEIGVAGPGFINFFLAPAALAQSVAQAMEHDM